MGPQYLVIDTNETKIVKWCYREDEAKAIARQSPRHITYKNVQDIAFSYFTKRN